MRAVFVVLGVVFAVAGSALALAPSGLDLDFSREPLVEQFYPRSDASLRSYEVDGTLTRRGALVVGGVATFDGDHGTVFLPVEGVSRLRVRGVGPRITRSGSRIRVEVASHTARIRYVLPKAVVGWNDIAELHWPLLAAADGATINDDTVRLTGRLFLPKEPKRGLAAGLHGVYSARESRTGKILLFEGDAPPQRGASLSAAIPRHVVGALPAGQVRPGSGRLAYGIRQRTLESIDRSFGRVHSTSEWTRNLVTLVIAGVAFVPPALLWLAVFWGAVRHRLARRKLEPRNVPEYLREPPSRADPGVVSFLWNEGKVDRRAVAGSVLALAERKVVAIAATGAERFSLTVTREPFNGTPGEQLVLQSLRDAAGPDDTIEAPPLWPGRFAGWRAYRRDAAARALAQGLARYLFRRGPLALASIMTGVGIGIAFFPTASGAFFLVVVISTAVGIGLAAIGGLELTAEGRRQRAYWDAYRRHIADFTRMEEAPPATIGLWGPYLTYGTVLGAADRAARMLTPR